MFAVDNQVFLKQVEVNQSQGMTWNYVGPQAPTDNPYVPIVKEDGTEIILFKMK
jgi:hypothetical protein|tara:strand:+ start:368 stop:529 length:162 start_codon:yes stop_codon:yes gene_type:complete